MPAFFLNERELPVQASEQLILLDRNVVCAHRSSHKVHWREMCVPEGDHSIPALVEKQAGALRAEYLAWVHELGERKIRGKNIRRHLRIDKDFSFWWMTLIAEKAPFNCPEIFSVFKLRALEKLYLKLGCRGIILYSGDKRLHSVLAHWCRSLGHPYSWKQQKGLLKANLRGKFLQKIPHIFQAVASISRLLWSRRRHLSSPKTRALPHRQATIVTYFPNIVLEEAEKGRYRSRYWEKLHDLFDEGPWHINWIWIYEHNPLFSYQEAVALKKKLNDRVGTKENFFFLEELISLGTALNAFRDYLQVYCKALSLSSVKSYFSFKESSLNFWPFLSDDWNRSCFGDIALHGCLLHAEFNRYCQVMPPQEFGIFLWENQRWERAFIAAWRKFQQGKLVGSQHTTLPLLNLRFFEDQRTYLLGEDPPLLPDIYAVNGQKSNSVLAAANINGERRMLVEAVRYLFLKAFNGTKGSGSKNDERCLLVLTSFFPDEIKDQLFMLKAASKSGALEKFDSILLKPHPNSSVEAMVRDIVGDIGIEIVQGSLKELLAKADIVSAANATSALLEAAFAGVPILVHAIADKMNLNPLWGMPGVTFVYSTEEFVHGLNHPLNIEIDPDFFCLDEQLPRWKKLLNNICLDGNICGPHYFQ